MDFKEISEKAYKRTGIDKYWNLPTKYAYLQLEELYYKYKLGNISKENSIIQKQKIEKEYEWNQIEYNRALEVYKEYNKNRIENDLLLNALEKVTNKTEAIKIAYEIIANFIKDDSFIERNLQKFNKLDF